MTSQTQIILLREKKVHYITALFCIVVYNIPPLTQGTLLIQNEKMTFGFLTFWVWNFDDQNIIFFPTKMERICFLIFVTFLPSFENITLKSKAIITTQF